MANDLTQVPQEELLATLRETMKEVCSRLIKERFPGLPEEQFGWLLSEMIDWYDQYCDQYLHDSMDSHIANYIIDGEIPENFPLPKDFTVNII